MEMAGRVGARVAGALLGLMALAAVASPLAAQGSDPCQPPAGDTGFAEVRADVFAGTFDRVLPFDVPLRLCAKVPQGTKGLEVKVAEGRRKLALDDASCVAPPAIDPWGPAIPGRVDDLSFPTVTTARVVVPRLDAQRYYSFCFILNRPLTPEEMQKFRPEVREILDRELQTITSGDVGAAALTAARAARPRRAGPADAGGHRGRAGRERTRRAGPGRASAPAPHAAHPAGRARRRDGAVPGRPGQAAGRAERRPRRRPRQRRVWPGCSPRSQQEAPNQRRPPRPPRPDLRPRPPPGGDERTRSRWRWPPARTPTPRRPRATLASTTDCRGGRRGGAELRRHQPGVDRSAPADRDDDRAGRAAGGAGGAHPGGPRGAGGADRPGRCHRQGRGPHLHPRRRGEAAGRLPRRASSRR